MGHDEDDPGEIDSGEKPGGDAVAGEGGEGALGGGGGEKHGKAAEEEDGGGGGEEDGEGEGHGKFDLWNLKSRIWKGRGSAGGGFGGAEGGRIIVGGGEVGGGEFAGMVGVGLEARAADDGHGAVGFADEPDGAGGGDVEFGAEGRAVVAEHGVGETVGLALVQDVEDVPVVHLEGRLDEADEAPEIDGAEAVAVGGVVEAEEEVLDTVAVEGSERDLAGVSGGGDAVGAGEDFEAGLDFEGEAAAGEAHSAEGDFGLEHVGLAAGTRRGSVRRGLPLART